MNRFRRLAPWSLRVWGLFAALLPASLTGIAGDYSCEIDQLTSTPHESFRSSALALSEDGRSALILTLASAGNIPIFTKPELFYLDFDSGQWTQLTNTPADTFQYEIGADGELERIVFISNKNLTGENPAAYLQLFSFTRSQRDIRQLTSFTTPTRMNSPRLSGDGSTVVFVADGNPHGTNRDRSLEIFAYDFSRNRLEQITTLGQVTVASAPSLSYNGNRIAYLVTHALSGFSEIDLYDRNASSLRPLYTAPRLANPVITDDGSHLFFVTDIDPSGQNLDRSLEVFRLRLDLSDGETGIADQLSRFPEAQADSFDNLAISRDGKRLIFRSRRDLLEWQGNGAENLYLYDPAAGSLVQITQLRDFNEPATRIFTDRKGARVLFTSTADLTGGNPDGNAETFLASCHAQEIYYFPQIGEGFAGEIRFRTSFIIANTGPDADIQIDFFSFGGRPMAMDFGALGVTESIQMTLARGTPLILETQGEQAMQVGFATVRTSGKITATAVFTGSLVADSETVLYEAAVPTTRPISNFSVVVNTQGFFRTGLAMVNPVSAGGQLGGDAESTDAELLLRLYDDQYHQLAEKFVVLPAGQQQARFISQLFAEVPGVNEMVGLLTVQSNRPVAVLTLRQRDNPHKSFPADIPTLTTLEVAPGIPEVISPSSGHR